MADDNDVETKLVILAVAVTVVIWVISFAFNKLRDRVDEIEQRMGLVEESP